LALDSVLQAESSLASVQYLIITQPEGYATIFAGPNSVTAQAAKAPYETQDVRITSANARAVAR